MIEKITKYGWVVIELVFMLVVLCVLLSLILGKQSGGFIASVAANTVDFLEKVPSGTLLGIVLIVFLYLMFKSKASR